MLRLIKILFKRCKANNLRNTLNVHPASGIQKWEDTFHEMVKAMGLKSSVRIIHTNHALHIEMP